MTDRADQSTPWSDWFTWLHKGRCTGYWGNHITKSGILQRSIFAMLIAKPKNTTALMPMILLCTS